MIGRPQRAFRAGRIGAAVGLRGQTAAFRATHDDEEYTPAHEHSVSALPLPHYYTAVTVPSCPIAAEALHRALMIDLYYWPTPNGQKITIMLEETGLRHRVIPINIGRGDQFDPAFLAISPNNRMPVIVDREPLGGGAPISVFESGAILMYLADKYGKFLAKDGAKRWDTIQWLFFQMASVGPMFGQANHFNTYTKENIQYAKDRYNNESLRLYRVMDNRLRETQWLGCDDYTIADMATYAWTKSHKDRGVTEKDYPNFIRWFNAMAARPAVQRNDKMSTEIRERMNKQAEGKEAVNIYDTKDNNARLTAATTR